MLKLSWHGLQSCGEGVHGSASPAFELTIQPHNPWSAVNGTRGAHSLRLVLWKGNDAAGLRGGI